MMRPRGLPGMIRDVYIDDGILSTNDEYMMIEHQAKPDDIIVLKRVFAFCAAISLAIFLFIHIKKKPLA